MLCIRIAQIREHPNYTGLGCDLVQKFQILCAQQGEHGSNARDVACRSINARYKTRSNRIASAYENDRNGLSCSFCCKCRWKKVSSDNRHPTFHQLRRQSRQSIVMAIRCVVFDRHVLTVDDANLAQTLPEGFHQRQWLGRPLVKESYRRKRLLRPRRARPRSRRAAEQRDEIAAPDHSITSSA